jgi:hypothetical protein
MTGVAAFAYPYAPIRSARTVSIVIKRTFGGGAACDSTATESVDATTASHESHETSARKTRKTISFSCLSSVS